MPPSHALYKPKKIHHAHHLHQESDQRNSDWQKFLLTVERSLGKVQIFDKNLTGVSLKLEESVKLLMFLQQEIILPEEPKKYTTERGTHEISDRYALYLKKEHHILYNNNDFDNYMTTKEAIKLRDLLNGFDFSEGSK